MRNEIRRIDYEDPILQDKELIQIGKQALWDKKLYGSWDATIETVRERLHKTVPLVEIYYKVKKPRDLRDIQRREELVMILKYINNDISPTTFHEFIEYKQEENLATQTIGTKQIVDLKTT